MSIEINNKYGSIVYSQEIIAEIAAKAASEVYGVVGLQSISKGVASLLKKDAAKGVLIKENIDLVDIELHVAVQYGIKIGVVAQNIIEAVKYQTEMQLGIRIGQIDVFVDDIKVGE